MNSILELLNVWGPQVFAVAGRIFWQSSLLIVIMLVLDWMLQRKLRPGLRYMLWMVVLLKLVLPPSLALPSGLAWWLPTTVPVEPARHTSVLVTYGTSAPPAAEPDYVVARAAPRLSLPGGLLGATGLVSVGLAGVVIWRSLRLFRQASKRNSSTSPAWLADLTEEAGRAAGVRKRVDVRVVAATISPALFGLFNPVILLPQSLVSGLTAGKLRAILIHEFAHLRRGDVWVNCFQTLLQIIYWWHPLLWVANYRIRRVREEAVDEAVMVALRGDAETYAPTLLEVARLELHRPFASLGLVGILEPRGALRQRIERLLAFRSPGRARTGVVSLFCAVMFGAIALPMGRAPAANADLPQAANSHRPNRPAENSTPSKADSNLLREGKELYAAGKIDKAEQKFLLALQQDSRSHVAYYYLNLIEETRFRQQGSGIRNVTPRRQRISAKLEQLRADKVEFDEVPLEKALQWLTAESKRLDTAGPGITFILDPLPREQDPRAVLEKVNVRIVPPLTDVRLMDVLDGIIKTAEKPLKYSVEDFGIVFSFRANEVPALYTRMIKVEPGAFRMGLKSATGKDNVAEALREVLASVNIDMAPPKNIFMNDREGSIIVRAALEDLDPIEKAISALNATLPQVSLKARFIAISDEEERAFWERHKEAAASAVSLQLNNKEAESEVQKWRSLDPDCLLSEAGVTTLSGRQCQIQVIHLVKSINGMEGTNIPPVGPTLDVVPIVSADLLQLELAITAKINEFLGYDDPGPGRDLPLPRFRLRECTLNAKVKDGQTLVFGLNENASDDPPERPGEIKKCVLVMVTPALIDASGRSVRGK